MKNGKVVYIRATVESATPDRVQWKPYASTLTFGGNLEIEIPVPAEEVIEQEKGGKIVLTIAGYASALKAYTLELERMNDNANQERFNPNTKKY
jgi:hypothetical protein